MNKRVRYAIATGVTFASVVIFSICYFALKLPYGLRSVWPAFVFIFAFSLYLASRPLAEEDDV